MFDLISDIFSALSKNKLRTFLTGFSMAWGVFMLMLLLGCGNGLQNAVMLNYDDNSKNQITLFPGRSSMPYKGLQAGRRSIINDNVLERLRKDLPQIRTISPSRMAWGVTETYGSEYISGGGLYGVNPEYFDIHKIDIIRGRNINLLDAKQMRKVMIIHKKNAELLFKDADPLGEYVVVNNVPYQVVGIYNDSDRDQTPPDIVPLTTLEKIYPSANGYERVYLDVVGITNATQGEEFENRLRATLASACNFDPQDRSAVWVWNEASSYYETQSIFTGISMFLWLIGIGTLIAGIVGISNIMLVTVKERTKEFGIRKAIGARPGNIISLILTESLMITAAFGYAGMLLGILLLEGLGKMFPAPDPGVGFDSEPAMFVNPTVNLGIAAGAMFILIIAGLIAAYIPAKKAVQVKPIEALHYE